MDIKEEKMIRERYDKLAPLLFDESDIYSLLILLRRHSKKHSAVMEFADFVAHREKDRGHIWEYLNRTKTTFEKFGKEDITIEIQPVYSPEEIKNSFNTVFKQLGLTPVSDEIISGITLCIISLLHDVQMVTKRQAVFGNLSVGYDKNEISLLGNCKIVGLIKAPLFMQFPALSVKNEYMQGCSNEGVILAKNTVEVINNNGRLELVGV